ncbi:type VII secretion protein EsaA [Virgibacillus sp.]|uniref:type VII secretion protein EsaA n=1 Tax=Virgibacillus sp. TaxID=1872700 RepID=UPI00185EF647|nr:type VII secretion protein EsaA [Virgibacillus sp.]NWO13234.1 type VII secretion protein EsaA [Virgibacillus sp.]
MKKLHKRWFLFLVLIVILASGLSYLALSQQEQTEKDESESNKAMAVALVNEDEGSILNGQELAFGEAFVQGVNNEDNHEWFVVSRGVAESGLKRGTYDMMIVIPNDFSEKALSIDSESPDQVVLNYKINATDNEQIKAEAEKTASNILNQFNRRIIDVYFASIVGNLQNAQDNIGGIIEKQAVFTNTMSSEVYNPLDNYTNQFSTIKDSTEVSKDSFQGFQEIMNNFEKELLDDAELDEDYLSSVHDVKKLKEQNNTQILEFYQTLNEFDRSLKQQEVDQELERLQLANKLINEQLQNNGGMEANKPPVNSVMYQSNPGGNIATRANVLRKHLDDSLTQVQKTYNDIEKRINPEYWGGFTGVISDRLDGLLTNKLGKDDQLVNMLLKKPAVHAKDNIHKHIRRLPSMDMEDFEEVGLPKRTIKEIRNVIAVTEKYMNEDGLGKDENLNPGGDPTKLLSYKINKLKEKLHTSGMTMSDSVKLPKNKKSAQTFKLKIPKRILEKYNVENLQLTIPGIGEEDYTREYYDGEIILPANEEGVFTVQVTLRLRDKNSNIDIFQPIPWKWKLHQKDINNVDVPETAQIETAETPLVANAEVEVEQQGKNVDTSDNKAKQKPTSEEKSEGSDEQSDSEEGGSLGEDGETPGNNNPDEPGGGDVSDEDEPSDEEDSVPLEKLKPATKRVKVINNRINHEIMTPMEGMDKATNQLIKAVTNTVTPYQKLFSTYESYFGLHMGGPNLPEQIKGKPLKELATKDSLYYLFNKKDVPGLIKDYIVLQISDEVAKEIRTPWEQLQAQIEIHEEKVALMNSNADALVNKIDETAERARVLNKSLEATLSNVEAWREKSLNLLESQEQIQTKEDEEQSAIVSLDDSFQPLLSASQSLSEQAQSNVNEGDVVYDTFDSINEQATTIQESGDDIVQQVETLSENMTNKLMDDENFAENFTGVLANSRIGDRQNEDLYDFLSNPVQTSNEGTITSSDSFTPYYLVLICFIVVLFTAYVISTINQKRMERDPFSEGKTIMSLNIPITLITIGIGVLEGIVIGVVSSYTMEIADSDMLMLTTLIVLLITGMLLFSTYLLRQVKMIGMFILLVVLSLYLFLTNAFGTGIKGMETWKEFSPLQYVETLLFRVVQGEGNYSASIFIMIGVVIVGALANLFVVHRSTQKGDVGNEKEAEAS